ncbi:peptide chain release factor 2 [Desulfotomaculum copahuensis]|uniref:Peptide chain release factor 2 n=2 Tax=Desulfotomaculum copahuensis TaxID=1838280 RepID=A0A1B7LC20_9FIRM|nr:peptide chain release factor 2 [Desulfotomaculum copahuensis]
MLAPGFWDDQEKAQQVTQSLTGLKDRVAAYRTLAVGHEELSVLLVLGEEEADEAVVREVAGELKELERRVAGMELEVLLSGPYDRGNAIISLHAGAGGTEAQDWVQMLLRMYTRWAEEKGYRVNLVDVLPGDEAGIKSATLMVAGPNAYGYLRAEKGVHRLVRISPFDAAGRRHTSFASVDVLPEVQEDVEVAIEPEDLKIDTFRSGGAGGQHVNKTDSAVRITHLPTGIVVQCQSERSQISNRNTAMKLLKAKLLDLEMKKKEAELSALRGEQSEIAWGSQIRSYVFHPYSLVKDHRTGVEVGNVNAVMDGAIDEFIAAYLRERARGR